MLVDSHCHLQLIDYVKLGQDMSAVIAAAEQAGISKMLCVATTLDDFVKLQKISQQYPCVSISAGLHPNEAQGLPLDYEQLKTQCSDEHVIAVGETGLDYYREPKEQLKWQRDRFMQHIEVAHAVSKPVIIHSRDALEDTLACIKSGNLCAVGGILHCCTYDWQAVKKFLDYNLMISLAGIVTFKNAEYLREVAAKVPLDRILVETDSPYLAPAPHRGKINQPRLVTHTAEAIAVARNTTIEQIYHSTTDNFNRLFAIN